MMSQVIVGLGLAILSVGGLIWLFHLVSRSYRIGMAKADLIDYMDAHGISHPYLRARIHGIQSDDLLAANKLEECRYQIILVERSMHHG